MQITYQLILNYQKLNYLRWYNQEDRLGRLLGPLLKTRLPLIKHVIKPLPKSVLIHLGLTAAAAAAAGSGIHKKILGSGNRHSFSASHTTLIISNDEINDY